MRNPTGSIKLLDNAAFGVRPQGSAADPSRQTITLISNFAKISPFMRLA
jgi:hypothetical protein